MENLIEKSKHIDNNRKSVNSYKPKLEEINSQLFEPFNTKNKSQTIYIRKASVKQHLLPVKYDP
jgi:hypothetical protein